MNRWILLLLLSALTLATALRVPDLGLRPMHNDEGVNAYKFAKLWETGEYKYDPNEHHGPTLYYGSYLLCRLTGAPPSSGLSDARLRVLVVLFGLGMVVLLPLIVDGMGRRGTVYAGLFTALSPAMVFYSRYYIHEMLLVFFTFLALGAGWRYWRSRKLGWALVTGAAVGLMDATKETFVLTCAAALIGVGLNQAWNRWVDASVRPERPPRLNFWHMGAALAMWVAIAVLLFSSFLTNIAGPFDSIRSYVPWLNRAGGDSPHINPWYFYFQRLLWFGSPKGPVFTELLIFVLACVGAASGFIRKGLGLTNASFVRFLALYTVSLAGMYSVISYKTPWCLLSFWHGVILLAGVGLALIIRVSQGSWFRYAVPVVVAAGCVHLAWQSWAMNGKYAADPGNPHVYAHTSPDFKRLVHDVERIASASTPGTPCVIKVVAPDDDFWPLPWYLRNYTTGWYSALPQDPYAPIMLVSARLDARLDERKTHLMAGIYQLRPQVFFELYVELELWKAHLAKNPPPAE
jgi:uncharacterized protein (TIGR03663 family)